ncbi:unnamed protein product [Cylicocyclus nassatus]|uniref:mRNA cap guanine-N(7) methyltransferase n=1 Tax=Cylicocyclus nassatus TaxID=53992 RepID=A0AA36DSQ5_CYLNA|nr:unnamed protein product [Cylicocyclus nassatus]
MSTSEVNSEYELNRPKSMKLRNSLNIFFMMRRENFLRGILIMQSLSNVHHSVNKMLRPRVLDLACGKGGDLRKWKIANVDSVVMADVADVSLTQAKERYDEMAQRERSGLFPAEFVHADCCKDNLKSMIKSKPEFDLVSCQFALHYSFIDEHSARTFLRNATETLRPGGYYIGTLPDAERIVWAVRENDGEFKNAVCSVRYDNKEEMERPPLFGAKFHFTLDSQVNCPEFLAYFPLVKKLLEELDMELVFVRKFPEALQHWKTTGGGLLTRMQALEPYPPRNGAKLSAEDAESCLAIIIKNRLHSVLLPNFDAEHSLFQGTLSKSEWEAFCMYLVFAFRKKGAAEEPTSSKPENEREEPPIKKRSEETDARDGLPIKRRLSEEAESSS